MFTLPFSQVPRRAPASSLGSARQTRTRTLLITGAVGVLAGAAARLLYAVLPEPWGTLANTSALWGLVPFTLALGLRVSPRLATLLGITGLATMVAVWTLLAPEPETPRTLVLVAVVGVLAGALCGLAIG